jgi:hypothetical protein
MNNCSASFDPMTRSWLHAFLKGKDQSRISMRRIMIAAAAMALGTAPALAQNVDLSGGLVNVTIDDVSILNNFLNDTQIAALNNLNVPITVQAPIGIAATVCGVSANVLASQQQEGDATCEATSGSEAFAELVNRQLLRQQR